MKSAVINFKVDPQLKAAAQARAKKLGVSLSMVLHSHLQEFAAGAGKEPYGINFPEEEMAPHMTTLIAEIEEENEREGTVGPFESVEEAIEYLKTLHNDS